MELNWSTFILEIVNFLILVWILKRFLYRPILDIIARRRESVEKTLAEAETVKTEADALQEKYQRRLADWETEKNEAWENLQREIAAERARRLEQLRAELDKEREKNRILDQRRLDELARRQEAAAFDLAARFARRLLERLTGPELEARLVDAALDDLEQLPEDRVSALQTNYGNGDHALPLQVESAWDLDQTRRRRLQETLDRLLGRPADFRFKRNAELIAGLRVTLGAWVIQANLRDELRFFAENVHAGA